MTENQTVCFAQLPKRSAPDHFATEDEYRDWSDEDEPASPANDAQQVRTTQALGMLLVYQQDPAETFSLLFLQAALFPQVAAAVQQAIAALGGAVVPKLNWSCPKV